MLVVSGKAYSLLEYNDDMTGVLVQCTFANTPVVSPDNKKPRQAGFKVFQIVALHRCHRGAALPSMNGLSDFLARFQHHSE
ncbi:hypothetical protein L8T19_15610 [Enterobacter bugandensis]|uniref:hypothetical protein n=1 Tax=Enterobacter TaxID=547 RepID=UPI001F17AF09|nr:MULTISPECIES: hypothetical protein [Enterobacter]MCF8585045.1 hypothetical protein [Enterobacter asburiae]MCK6779332.1 hypothetical protein [Enterobacter bugandensis]